MKENKFLEFCKKVYDFVLKHWKVLAICLLVCLMLGQCSSCSRDKRAERTKIELAQKNAVIDSLNMELKHINERFTDAQSHNSNFTNIATSNQNRNIQIIDSLRNEITKRERTNSNLNTTINNLNKQIEELKLIIKSQSNEIENLRKQ